MSQSSRILLIAGGIYLIVAVVGFRYGIDLFKDQKIYEILAYLIIYQIVVYLILCEPLSKLSLRVKVLMLMFVGLVIMGQLLNNSRKFYPFSSWRMYSTAVPGGVVTLLESKDSDGIILKLNSSMFSPGRSSRPHEQYMRALVSQRERENEKYQLLMNYYCEILKKRGWEAETIQINLVKYDTHGKKESASLIGIYECKKQ